MLGWQMNFNTYPITGVPSAESKEVRAWPTTPPAGPERTARSPENLKAISLVNNTTHKEKVDCYWAS